MADEKSTDSQTVNKLLVSALLCTLGGGGWGTLELSKLTDEVRVLRQELSEVRKEQAKATTVTTRDIAALQTEVAAMRRDIDRIIDKP